MCLFIETKGIPLISSPSSVATKMQTSWKASLEQIVWFVCSGFHVLLTNSHTHSYTDGRDRHARCQPAHQEQFGIQCLSKGQSDVQLGNLRIKLPTFRLVDNLLHLLSPSRPVETWRCNMEDSEEKGLAPSSDIWKAHSKATQTQRFLV